jgi:GNAT superfamily N-acetyltransferase
VRIEPVTPDHLDDLDTLFARGDPRFCQCAFMRLTNAGWQASTPESNRALHGSAVRKAHAEGRAAGLIAYDGDGPVGWVSFGPRAEFSRLAASRLYAPVDDADVWSVICFVVAARARRRGLAAALLDAAVDYAREQGVANLEAYPVDVQAAGAKPSSASLWRGTLTMFEAAGFEVVARRRQNARSAPRPIVRLRV